MSTFPNPEARITVIPPQNVIRTLEIADSPDVLIPVTEQDQSSIEIDTPIIAHEANDHLSPTQPKVPSNYEHDARKVAKALTDPNAYEALIADYSGLVRSVADQYYFPGGEKDDVLQEARLGLFKAIRVYDGQSSSLNSFAALCMHRQIISTLKSMQTAKQEALNTSVRFESVKSSDGSELSLLEVLPDESLTAEERVIGRAGLNGLVDFMLDNLSPLEHDAINGLMRGLTYDQIADELGVSSKAIDNALLRAKRKIQKYKSQQELADEVAGIQTGYGNDARLSMRSATLREALAADAALRRYEITVKRSFKNHISHLIRQFTGLKEFDTSGDYHGVDAAIVKPLIASLERMYQTSLKILQPDTSEENRRAQLLNELNSLYGILEGDTFTPTDPDRAPLHATRAVLGRYVCKLSAGSVVNSSDPIQSIRATEL